MTDNDIKIFSKICEKGINDYTKKNTEYTDDFKLSEQQAKSYRLVDSEYLASLTVNQFCKVAISDQFQLAVEIVKSKVFLKCYQDSVLIIEIAMSKAQLAALEDKFYYNVEMFDGQVPSQTYNLFYAGTFMRKNESGPLSSKLVDLRLLKFVDIRDVY